MKEIFFIGGICLLSTLSLKAQSTIHYRFGLTSGIQASNVVIPHFNNHNDLSLHYTGGISLEQQFSPALALSYQLLYSRLGGISTSTGNGASITFITDYNYLTLPIMIRIRPKGERAFVGLGGQVGYYLNGKNYVKGKQDQALQNQNITKVDAGLTAGIGYRLGQHLVVDGRYYHSLRKLYEDFTAPSPATGQPTFYRSVAQYHRMYSVTLSYYF